MKPSAFFPWPDSMLQKVTRLPLRMHEKTTKTAGSNCWIQTYVDSSSIGRCDFFYAIYSRCTDCTHHNSAVEKRPVFLGIATRTPGKAVSHTHAKPVACQYCVEVLRAACPRVSAGLARCPPTLRERREKSPRCSKRHFPHRRRADPCTVDLGSLVWTQSG